MPESLRPMTTRNRSDTLTYINTGAIGTNKRSKPKEGALDGPSYNAMRLSSVA
jgi:hypothetical protein